MNTEWKDVILEVPEDFKVVMVCVEDNSDLSIRLQLGLRVRYKDTDKTCWYSSASGGMFEGKTIRYWCDLPNAPEQAGKLFKKHAIPELVDKFHCDYVDDLYDARSKLQGIINSHDDEACHRCRDLKAKYNRNLKKTVCPRNSSNSSYHHEDGESNEYIT